MDGSSVYLTSITAVRPHDHLAESPDRADTPQCKISLSAAANGIPSDRIGVLFHDTRLPATKTGWRIDGVLRPRERADPFYVIEIQAYGLPSFYANLFSKVFGFLELNDPHQDWRAVAIFLERGFEPTETTPYEDLLNSARVRRIYLDELPPQSDPPLALGIWQLVAAPEVRVKELLPKLLHKARNELSDRVLSGQVIQLSGQVIQLVQEFLVKRFVNLSREEMSRMLELHDIRDSRAVKEVCEETRRQTKRDTERQTKEDIARKLLAEGVAPATIAKAAGLTLKEVRRLASAKQ